jgi:hypothetical protein
VSQSYVVLDQLKEGRDFSQQEANRLDVVLIQHPSNVIEDQPDIMQKGY